MKVYLIFVIFFDLWSILLYAFTEKFSRLYHLHISISFTGSSLLYLYLLEMILYFEMKSIAWPYMIICLIIYMLVIITMVFIVKDKFRNGYSDNKKVKLTTGMAGVCGAIGVALPKPEILGSLPLAIALFILSCAMACTIPSCHQFYMVMKNSRREKIQSSI